MIRAIVFDLGGVLAEFTGIEPLIRLSQNTLTLADAKRFWLHSFWIKEFESGRCTEQEFATGVISELNLSLDPEEFLIEFMSWEKGVFPGALELLDSLKPRFLLACLSNNNALHWKILREKSHIDAKFDRCYISYETGLLKPNKKAFEYVLSDLGLAAHEILFFDDNQECIQAALYVGIKAFQVDGIDGIYNILRDLELR